MGRGIAFQKQNSTKNELAVFVDSDYASYLDTRKSISYYVFTLYDGAISWKSCLQKVLVALSTSEAEYMTASKVVK